MRPAPQFAARSLVPASEAGRRALGDEGGANAEYSFAWKGWTNGGGERISTAAQFSRLTEHGTALPTTPPAVSAGRGTVSAPVPVAPAAPSYPTNESTLLAPIHAALERLISRGQDQLAVTVRFEQGGSLSLKLTLRDGGIAAHMQTDLPGLEEALRSSWSTFAQDWNQRGVKLAAPTFSTDGSPHHSAGRDGQRSPHQDTPGFPGEAPAFGAMFNRRAFRGDSRAASGAPARSAGLDAPLAHLASRGLRTWA